MNKDRILIIRAGALGDTLMLLPSINALKTYYKVIVLGRPPGIGYLESCADKCMDIEKEGWHRLFSQEADITGIPSPEVDHVIAFINDRENIMSENLRRLFPYSTIDVFSPFPDPGSKFHVASFMARAIQAAGIRIDYDTAFDTALKKPLIKSCKGVKKMAVLHPGSGSKTKNYSPDFWFRLLTNIKEENDNRMDTGFLLGPAEEDVFTVFYERAEEYGARIICCPDKQELLSILDSTYLYIGHDSGVTHLAAMLGIHTIAIFKDSSIDLWRPIGPSVRIIEPDMNPDFVLKKVVRESADLMARIGNID